MLDPKSIIALIIVAGLPLLIIASFRRWYRDRTLRRHLQEAALMEVTCFLRGQRAEGWAAVTAGMVMDAVAEELATQFPGTDGALIRAIADSAPGDAWQRNLINVARGEDGHVYSAPLTDTGGFDSRAILVCLATE